MRFAKMARTFLIVIVMLVCFPMSASASSKDAEMKDGEVRYGPVKDTTATSSVTWATEGFTVKKDKCLPEGDPTKGAKGEFNLKNGEKKEFVQGGATYVTFTFPEAKATAQFKKAGINAASLEKTGGYVYLNGIMQVYKSGKATGRIYATLKGIMNAEPWRNPNDFKDRFDIRLPYEPAEQPVEILFQETNSNVKTNVSKVTYPKQRTNTLFKANGTHIPQTLQSKKTGRNYKLYRVHYVELGAKTQTAKATKTTTINPRTNYDAYVLDLDRIRKRSFEVPDGGLQIVAVYRWFTEGNTDSSELMEEELLEPVPKAAIQADNRGSEKFDTTQGIPTTEKQYVNVISEDYLMSYQFKRYFGSKQYTQVIPGGEDQPPVITTVTRNYSYWKIEELHVYELDHALVQNYSLPGQSVTLKPGNSYQKPSVTYTVNSSNMVEPVSGGSSVGNIKVRNDKLIVNGKTIMDGGWTESTAAKPQKIPFGKEVDKNVFFQSGLVINKDKANGEFESSGSVVYKQIANVGTSLGKSLTFEVEDVNDVIIHTPTVCDAKIQDVKQYNQMIQPNRAVAGIVLDRYFSVSLPVTGDHKYILGYGYQNYGKYIADRQVRFPFDVFKNDVYIPGNTWSSIGDTTQFYLPVWVNEGEYQVEFRSISINSAANNGLNKSEYLANYDYDHYVASDTVPVEVSGRIYGLSLYDISDYPIWRSVFRKSNSLKLTGFQYKVGTKNQNGTETGKNSKYTFPLIHGSHPKYKNEGVIKPGYVTRFTLTTVGSMYGLNDEISIKPVFYYVDKKGKNRQIVDIYYSETIAGKKQNLVRVGSSLDKNNQKKIRLDDSYLTVPKEEIKNTAAILGTTIKKLGAINKNVYTFAKILIPYNLRTFIGEYKNRPSAVTKQTVSKSVQKWYGEYYLPSTVHVVPTGYDVIGYAKNKGVNYKEKFWLKNGYIIVNFEIETIKNGKRHLSYINAVNAKEGYCNMWKLEGAVARKTDYKGIKFSFIDGDYVLYDVDKGAKDDYKQGGTH